MSKITFLVLAFFLVACTSFKGQRDLAKVHRLAAKRLKKEYNFCPSGFGTSWPKDKCKLVSFYFLINKGVTVNEARRYLINAAQVVVDCARSVEGFERYLENPPFSFEQVNVMIHFDAPPEEIHEDCIDLAIFMGGLMSYHIDIGYKSVLLFRESYEDALQILAAEDQEMKVSY